MADMLTEIISEQKVLTAELTLFIEKHKAASADALGAALFETIRKLVPGLKRPKASAMFMANMTLLASGLPRVDFDYSLLDEKKDENENYEWVGFDKE